MISHSAWEEGSRRKPSGPVGLTCWPGGGQVSDPSPPPLCSGPDARMPVSSTCYRPARTTSKVE